MQTLHRSNRAIKKGNQTKALLGLQGCKVCAYRNTCKAYDETNENGCEARWEMITQARKEVGNVGFSLIKKGGLLSNDLEALRAELLSKGVNPLTHTQYLRAYNIHLELAKYLAKIKYGTEQHISVTHKHEKEEFMTINPVKYKPEDEVEAELVEEKEEEDEVSEVSEPKD